MEKKIKLKSRERINNWLEPYGDNSYLLESELDHIRVGRKDDKIICVDPPGGPFITKDSLIDEIDEIVESIDFDRDIGYIITTRDNGNKG